MRAPKLSAMQEDRTFEAPCYAVPAGLRKEIVQSVLRDSLSSRDEHSAHDGFQSLSPMSLVYCVAYGPPG